MITFVSFHVDLEGEALSPDTPLNSPQPLEYRELLMLMLKSASVFHADVRKVILTDTKSVFSDLPSDVEVQRYQIDANHMMLSRLYTQMEFLKAHDFKSNVVFLDTDILVNTNLETSLDWHEFDIAVTIRDDPKGMPVNGGVIFVSNRHPHRAIDFFKSFYQKYTHSFWDQSQWWGDQKALADILTRSGQEPVSLGMRQIGDISFQLLPCDTYNCSPTFEEELDVYGADLNRKIIHFKGNRKRFMKPFWDNCLSHQLCDRDLQVSTLQHQINRLQLARQTIKKKAEAERTHYLSLLKQKKLLDKRYAKLKKQYSHLKIRYQQMKENPFRLLLLVFKNGLSKSVRGKSFAKIRPTIQRKG
jgi:hypothetical protein